MRSRLRLALATRGLACAALVWLALAGTAEALQFTPTATARLHFPSDTQPGTSWNTVAAGVIEYRSLDEAVDPGLLTLSGFVDVMNYGDVSDPNCDDASGENCDFDYSPDLTLTVEGQFSALTVTPFDAPFENFVTIVMKFETTADGNADIVWSDPDFGDAVALEADWQEGDLGGVATTGLEATVFYDTVAEASFGSPSVAGVSLVDLGSAYASLFDDDDPNDPIASVMFETDSFFSFVATDPNLAAGLDAIIQRTLDPNNTNNVVPSFTAEGQGQIFRLASDAFVPIPEPSSLVLLGAALAGLAAMGRSRQT
jgi:hypothetical protein